VVQTWYNVRDFYGALTAVSSTEFWTARQTGASVDYYLDCRSHEADITPKHRILYGTRVFEIEGVMHNIASRPHKTKLRVFEVF
jgi:head-tail adaptor